MMKILYKLDNLMNSDFIATSLWFLPVLLCIFFSITSQSLIIENILIVCGFFSFMVPLPVIIMVIVEKDRNKKCNTYEDEIMSDTSTWD